MHRWQTPVVLDDQQLPARIYHLALRDEWRAAVDGGESYGRSTLGRSVAEEGFVHCSFALQVNQIANLVYRGRSDVVLLTVEVAKLQAEVRVENLQGGDEAFPHIYGPLPLDAVISAERVPLNENGTLAPAVLS